MARGRPSSQPADLVHGGGVVEGGGGFGAHHGGPLHEEAARGIGRERLDRAHQLAGNSQGFAAGGEDREPRAAGQQRLGEFGRRVDHVLAVVEDQELAARGAVRDEQGDRVVLRDRHLVGDQRCFAQTEGADHGTRDRLGPVERGQFGQPRLREPGGGLLGEAGLSRTARSGQRDQSCPPHIRTDGPDLAFPPDERVQTRTDVPGPLGTGGVPGPRSGVRCGTVRGRSGFPRSAGVRRVEQCGVQVPELRPGVGAETVHQRSAHVLVGGQRVGTPAGLAQGADEQNVQGLVVRVGRRQPLQLRYDVGGAAEPQVRLDAAARRLQAQGLRAGRRGAVGKVREGGAAPQGEGFAQSGGGGTGVARVERGPALRDEPLEHEQVHVVAGGAEAVAAGLGGDRVLPDGAAEAAHQCLQGCGGVLGRVVRPYLVDEGVRGERSGGVAGQGCEQRAYPGAAHRDEGPPVVLRLGNPQNPVPHAPILTAPPARGHRLTPTSRPHYPSLTGSPARREPSFAPSAPTRPVPGAPPRTPLLNRRRG